MADQCFSVLEGVSFSDKKTIFWNKTGCYPQDRFSWGQLKQIELGIDDDSIDIEMIYYYAKPTIPAKVMEQLRLGIKDGLSLADIELLIKLKIEQIPFIKITRLLLKEDGEYRELIKSIFFDNNKYLGNRFIKLDTYGSSVQIAEPISLLRVIDVFAKNNLTYLLQVYCKNNKLKSTREFLAFCSKAKSEVAIEWLRNEIPLNVIFCYCYCNDSRKTWDEIKQFIGLHKSARDFYIRAFCEGKLDNINIGEAMKLFDINSNRLIDELFFTHNIPVKSLGAFTDYIDLNQEKGTKHMFSGYPLGRSKEPRELARVIAELLKRGIASTEIANNHISPDCKYKVLTLCVAIAHKTRLEDAVVIADKIHSKYHGKNITHELIEEFKEDYLSRNNN